MVAERVENFHRFLLDKKVSKPSKRKETLSTFATKPAKG